MAEWTREQEDEWQRLSSIPILERTKQERLELVSLGAVRDSHLRLLALEEERERQKLRERRERSGPLYKVGLVLAVVGFGACGLGWSGDKSGDLIGGGTILLVLSGLVNGLNQWLTRTG